MKTKYLRYIGPLMTDEDPAGNEIALFTPGEIILSKHLVSVNEEAYTDTRQGVANMITKSYFKNYYPILMSLGAVLFIGLIFYYVRKNY